jgi:hypothetical protein
MPSTVSTSLRLSFLILLLALLTAAGCGSRDSSTGSDADATTPAHTTPTAPQHGSAPDAEGTSKARKQQTEKPQRGQVPTGAKDFHPPAHDDSGGGSQQFEAKGGDNSIQEFGSESSGDEFAEAAAALHGYLDARAAGSWAAACDYIAPGFAKSVSSLAQGSEEVGCPKLLAQLSAGVPAAALREAAIADVGSLRAEGDSGFVIFTGRGGETYFMPMSHQGGRWRVAALAPSALL